MAARAAAIAGRLSVDGRPAAGQQVLLLSEEARTLLDGAITDEAGAFRLTPREPADGALVLLAKLRGEVATVLAAAVPDEGPVDLDLDTAGLVELEGRLEGEDTEGVGVRLDPVRIDGLPDWLVAFAPMVAPRVAESSFARLPTRAGEFRVRLRPGTYRIGGDRIVYDQARVEGPRERNLIVDRVRLEPGGRELAGEPFGGFLLELAGDARAVLSLRELEVEDL